MRRRRTEARPVEGPHRGGARLGWRRGGVRLRWRRAAGASPRRASWASSAPASAVRTRMLSSASPPDRNWATSGHPREDLARELERDLEELRGIARLHPGRGAGGPLGGHPPGALQRLETDMLCEENTNQSSIRRSLPQGHQGYVIWYDLVCFL